MPLNGTIITTSIALVAISLSHANALSKSGSPQMTMNAGAQPAGTTKSHDRPAQILAEDRKAEPPALGSRSANPAPAPEPPVDNREMDRPQRASPEAANDLFQLLKQAGPKQGQKPK